MSYQSDVAEALASLKRRFALLADLGDVEGLLSWDQHTYLPPLAARGRGRQTAALESISHEKLTDPRVGEWLARLEGSELRDDDAALVRLCRRQFDRAVKTPAELVERLATARSEGHQAWLEARRQEDFSLFAPQLQQLFDLNREQADHLGYEEHPYDALHDAYEPASTAARVSELFDQLRPALVEVVEQVRRSGGQDAQEVLYGDFEPSHQEQFVRKQVERFGFDFQRGRLDLTVHPFAQSIGRDDVRITTRYRRDYLGTGLFAGFHEAGHGMYEQGVAEEHSRSPLGASVGLGMHESQSRMWENLVGRSLPFWRGVYPELQTLFPEQLGDVSLDHFYRAVNTVKPSLIRIEADEVTYNLHVMVRFELELALLEGVLDARGVPEAWNSRYEELLGLTPPGDVLGCLQDVHWSVGLIGYFPTYSLGNVMSVQLFEAARRDLPGLDGQLESGEFAPLLEWMRREVHTQGSRYQPDDLLERATGSRLDAAPYLRYLREKFGALYGLAVPS